MKRKDFILSVLGVLGFTITAKADSRKTAPDSSEYQYSLYAEPDGQGDNFIETITFESGMTRRQMIIEVGHATESGHAKGLGGGGLIGQGATSSTEEITSCNASSYAGYNFWYNLPKMIADLDRD